MAPKLSFTASETLNDIILHQLQNEGLAHAEKLEQAFDDAFAGLSASPQAQKNTIALPENLQALTVSDQFIIIYQALPEAVTVLDISHISRYTHLLNPSS